jgi:phosphoribosylanthranilate isomerase
MLIKVCGLRAPENVRAVARQAVDCVGFIFYERSPRFVGADWPGLPGDAVPASTRRIGVFVDAPVVSILETVGRYALDLVQLHGADAPADCAALARHVPVIKAFGVHEDFDFAITAPYAGLCRYFLFDTKTPAHGGSGVRFDWSVLGRYAGATPFLLSGGIGPDDADTVLALRHDALAGVDLNSRFEREPGLKDLEKLQTFLNRLR